MANLGKWGALAGLGQGTTEYGNTIREQWLQAEKADQQLRLDDAKDKRGSAEWDRRHATETNDSRETNDLRNQYEISLEGVRHKNRMAEDAASNANKSGNPEYWRAGDTSYKVEGGVTYALQPGSTKWERVSEAGESGGAVDPEEMSLLADKYADQRIKEQAGWLSSDSSDFSAYGGSRAKAREYFRNEFLQGRQGGSQQGANPGPADTTSSTSAPQVPAELKPVADKARAAISRGVSRDAVIQRLKEAGATDAQISQMGL